jgi:transcription initiation factor TFIIIB Brf1 subunit/transcription initiation factor TFIIB
MKCSKCNSENILETDIETYCGDCGLVIDSNPIRFYINPDKDNMVLYSGRSIKISNRMLRLKTIDKWNRSSKSVNEINFLKELSYLSRIVKAPDNIYKDAVKIYHKSEILKKYGIVKHKALACLYLAYQINHSTLFVRQVDDIKINDVFKYIRKVALELNIKINYSTPMTFLPQFCAALGLSREDTELCKKYAEIAMEINPNRGPSLIAAGAIYTVVKLKNIKDIKMSDISNVCKRYDIQIREVYNDLLHSGKILRIQNNE